MRTLFAFGAAALACVAPSAVYAGDLGGYEERETYVERPARVIERGRIIERRYYEPRYYYDEESVMHYVPRPRVYQYYAADYPYYYRPRFYHPHHYWRGHGRW